MESAPTSTSSASSVTSSDGRNGGAVGGGGSEFLNLGMFGQQSSGGSDLLLGTGGFAGGLGNGYGNEAGVLTGNSATSGPSSTAFDLNDFPSLGGGAGTVGSGATSNGLAAALRQQQQLLAHQQMLKSNSAGSAQSSNLYRLAMSSGQAAGQNFTMATEDFPALPGAPPQSSGGPNVNGSVGGEPGNSPLPSSGNAGFGVQSMSRQSSGASGSGLYGIELDGNNPLEASGGSGGSGLLGGLGGGGLATGSNPGASLGHQRSSTPSSTSAGNVGGSSAPGGGSGSTLSGDFGLLGLLGVIRMTDADRNALALGSDLTLLGLNLNSNDQIYSTFPGPWSENPATKEPQYQVSMRRPCRRLDVYVLSHLIFTHSFIPFILSLASHVLLYATTRIEDGTSL